MNTRSAGSSKLEADTTKLGTESRLESQARMVILTSQQYKTLEASLPQPDPRTTDPVQAGIQLGIQIVLRKLRDGFVA